MVSTVAGRTDLTTAARHRQAVSGHQGVRFVHGPLGRPVVGSSVAARAAFACRRTPAADVWRVRLLLIDGHYYVYRSFHAIQSLSNSRGEPTNAIYGFVKTVRKMLKDIQPAYAAVFWDEGLPERRTSLQPSYKQQREAMPDKMVPQLDFIRRLCASMGLTSIGKANTEADDLMACYVTAALDRDIDCVLATNDKDLFQLVGSKVHVYSTNKGDLRNPQDPFVLLGETEVLKKWGVPPSGIGEVLALTGDGVDNIPGIEGVGPKTAAALIREFGTVESLLQNLERLPNAKLREKLAAAQIQVRHNREMVRLELDHDLLIPIESLVIRPDYSAYLAALRQCEFRSLVNEVTVEAGQTIRTEQQELF